MSELKKADLLDALAGLDAAVEQVIEDVRLQDRRHPCIGALDRARSWPKPLRDAVNVLRKERGMVTDELLMHETIRRINNEFVTSPSWEVKSWREIERLETSERIFEVTLLGVDLPKEGEELIPAERRGGDLVTEEKPSDFCTCGHTRGSHYLEIPAFGHGTEPAECGVKGCQCSRFRLLASGVEGVEEPPPDPHPLLTIPNAPDEALAMCFLSELAEEAALMEVDPQTWMALQRLVSKGWRFTPPADNTTTGDKDE